MGAKTMLLVLLTTAWLSSAVMSADDATSTTTTVAQPPTLQQHDDAGWSTHLHVQLTNDYQTFSIDSCPQEAFENLRVELFSWVQDELLSIFGTFSNLSEFEYTHDPNDVLAKHVPLEAKYGCKVCGKKQWSSDRSMHNIAFLLQWFTQLALDEWIVNNQELLEGCMDDKIHVLFSIEKLGLPSKVYQASSSKFSKSSLETLSLFQK